MFNNINTKNKKLYTFLNPYSYLFARQNKELFKKFNIKVDGMLLVKVFNLFGFKGIKRESFDMTSLAAVVFDDAIDNSKSIYFIGTKPKVIDKAIENIINKFPNLNVVGYRDGYIKDIREEVLTTITNLNPDIVVCGMGTPLQEQFLVDLQKRGWNGIGYTCGGFLHQTVKGGINYYPSWINKYNLRWLYRMYDEPKLIKRYFLYYPWFVFVFIYDVIRYRLGLK